MFCFNQRAQSKITFPSYWANTCCSHPLFSDDELEADNALGVKRAARRKMEQELGINPDELPLSCFEFVTRIHYSAPCGKHGNPVDYWGEHEIDHVLICMPPRLPRIHENPNEVAETRLFSPCELANWESNAADQGERVSPWFRLMERTMLYKWWKQAALGLSSVPEIAEWDTIHRLDSIKSLPSNSEVLGQAREAEKAWISATALKSTSSIAKQGAYGKIVTHKESILKQMVHVDEMLSVFLHKTKLSASAKVAPLGDDAPEYQIWCETMLGKVSRSFATVIQQLNPRLRASICVFYLVLRGLDTVEDDMMAFLGREGEKVSHLKAFYKYLDKEGWCMKGVGEGDEATLLESFNRVIEFYQHLPEGDRVVIRAVCKKMGKGMGDYVSRDLREGTTDILDYNTYCHYVAGLVGEGLSQLFSSSGYEDESLASEKKLANDMGLFLQKTNIIRDYLEDLVDLRAFWPQSVWKDTYGVEKLADLRGEGGPSVGDGRQPHKPHPRSLEVLNHLVADALSHAPACLDYLSRLQTDDVFRFCAIPQVMAIATLDKLTNNQDVFTGVVKIRKAQALRLMQEAGTMNNVASVFLKHVRSIASKIPAGHSIAYDMVQDASQKTQETALNLLPPVAAAFKSNVILSQAFSLPTVGFVLALFCVLTRYLYSRTPEWAMSGRYMPRLTDSWDVAALASVLACVLYLFAFTGVPLVMSAQQSNQKGITSRWSESEDSPSEADSPSEGSAYQQQYYPRRRRLSH